MTDHPSPLPSCWVLTPGAAGMENQALGLAEAMGLRPRIHRLSVPKPWVWLPPNATFSADRVLSKSRAIDGTPLPSELPDILISCGRRVILPAVALKRRAGSAMTGIYLQDPKIDPKHFDWVIAPEHDHLTGANVLVSAGAVHRVGRSRVDAAANNAEPWMIPTGSPRVAVLIGGSSRAYTLSNEQADRIAADLRALADQGCGLMVSTSRRTGADVADRLEAALQGTGACFHRPDRAEGRANPYFAFLGLADHILVTGDSVSMVSEAASLGRPVGIIALAPNPGRSRKIESFLDGLLRRGAVELFTGTLPSPQTEPLQEPARLAEILWEKIENTKP